MEMKLIDNDENDDILMIMCEKKWQITNNENEMIIEAW